MILNPYESPGDAVKARTALAKRRPILYIATSLVLLLAGLGTLLLLNGQLFTNSLIALMLITLSGLLWLPLMSEDRWKKLAMWVLFTHIVLVVGLLPGFGERYEAQKKFNEAAAAHSKSKG